MWHILFHHLLEVYDTQALLHALLSSLLPTFMVKAFLKTHLLLFLCVCLIGLSQIPVFLAQTHFTLTVLSSLLVQVFASYRTEVLRLQEFDIQAIVEASVDGGRRSTKGTLKQMAKTYSSTCLIGYNTLLDDGSYT